MLKITETEAVKRFVLHVMDISKEIWPVFYNNFKDVYKDKFVIENEVVAIFDLSLAVIAQEIQALDNLFPKPQAERIHKLVFHFIEKYKNGKYAIEEIKKYEEDFKKAFNNTDKGVGPMEAIPRRLLHRWLGENISNFYFETEINGNKMRIIEPAFVLYVQTTIISLCGLWNKVKNDFELTDTN